MHVRTPHGRRPVRRRELAGLVTLAVLVSGVLAIDAAATELTAPDVTTAAATDVTMAAPPYASFDAGPAPAGALPDGVEDPQADGTVATTLRGQTRREAAQERREALEARYAIWDRLADCESGAWNRNGQPIAGSARWDYGLDPSHGAIFEGGLQFHPNTWDAFKLPGMPSHAGQATRQQQIAVAELVLDAQGWGAWPKCSRKLGYR